MEAPGACCRNISREGELLMEKTRSSFTGKLGFVLAAAGSAVGLGNLWRFPYLAAQYGGGIFLLVYLVLVVTFGFALMAGEVALGRKTGLSAVGAFQVLNKKWKFLGYLTSIVPMIILPYYCVIGGWVIKYFSVFLTGQMAAAADASYFGNFAAGVFEPIGWLFVYLGITAVIVYLGVEKGVEKASRLMMPALVVLTLCVTVFVLAQPGALEGVLYYITPDFSRFSSGTVLAALGQLFYSMSLAMGIMITYGSYMKKDVNLEKSVSQIEIFDTGFAFLAGLMIVPAVTVFGDMSQMNTGPSLMFVTLPGVFAKMGPVLGSVVGGAVLPARAVRRAHLLHLADGDGGVHPAGQAQVGPPLHVHGGGRVRLPHRHPQLAGQRRVGEREAVRHGFPHLLRLYQQQRAHAHRGLPHLPVHRLGDEAGHVRQGDPPFLAVPPGKAVPRGDPLHCAGVHCGDPHLLRVPACVTARRTRCGAGWPRGSQSPAARGGLAFLHKKNRKSSAKKAK